MCLKGWKDNKVLLNTYSVMLVGFEFNEPINTIKVMSRAPVVQSIVSLTSSLRVISLTVLADSIYNILIFFAEKM